LTILSVLALGLFVGGLARWAIPGPDPMPIWLTFLIGLAGASIGGGITAAIAPGNRFAILLVSVAVAAVLVAGYRRFVQKRPITGPEAYRLPTRGVGIARLRDRLRRMGVDPNAVGREATDGAREAARLRQMRDDGLLTEEEYEERLRRLRDG
jgi:uncharacterized membrane protein YeaQ/YmgE (transglycosylase-associated protein family)